MKYQIRKDLSVLYLARTLYRIEALKSFGDVKAGDLGGYIEREGNLSQYGNCWVYVDAKIFDNCWVYEDARVYGNAEVYGNARVFGNALISNTKAISILEDTITANYIYRWGSSDSYIEHLSLNCTYEEAKDLMSKKEFKLWKEVFKNSLLKLK